MTGLHDMLNPRGGALEDGADLDSATSSAGGPYACKVATSPAAGERVAVTGGAFGTSRVTGARWVTSDGNPPNRGDAALALFDDNGDPWVFAWNGD